MKYKKDDNFHFEEIKIDNKKSIDNYINLLVLRTNESIISDWNFESLIFYEEIPNFKYQIIGKSLYLLGSVFNRNGLFFYPIFGKYDLNSFSSIIFNLFKNINKTDHLNFCFVSYDLLKYFIFLKKIKYKIKIFYARDESDYVYLIKDFKKYMNKNKILKFIKIYNPEFEFINEGNKDICFYIQKKYWCEKRKQCNECTYCSLNFIKNIIKNYNSLNFNGFFVKNKSDYLGFALTLKNKNTVTVYEMKHSYINGLNYYIFDIIITKIADNDIKWINLTSDDGILSLRRYKSHLCKNFKLLNKYYVTIFKKQGR